MSAAAGIRMKNPAHPGGFVKHEIIEPHGLSVTDAARVLGVTRPALSALLNERASLSPEMALRIEKAFGVSMDTLTRMQNSYDIGQARQRKSEIDVTPYARDPKPSLVGAMQPQKKERVPRSQRHTHWLASRGSALRQLGNLHGPFATRLLRSTVGAKSAGCCLRFWQCDGRNCACRSRRYR